MDLIRHVGTSPISMAPQRHVVTHATQPSEVLGAPTDVFVVVVGRGVPRATHVAARGPTALEALLRVSGPSFEMTVRDAGLSVGFTVDLRIHGVGAHPRPHLARAYKFTAGDQDWQIIVRRLGVSLMAGPHVSAPRSGMWQVVVKGQQEAIASSDQVHQFAVREHQYAWSKFEPHATVMHPNSRFLTPEGHLHLEITMCAAPPVPGVDCSPPL